MRKYKVVRRKLITLGIDVEFLGFLIVVFSQSVFKGPFQSNLGVRLHVKYSVLVFSFLI